MTFLEATILGIVEGLTEFLPVSSTGHLILTNALLGLDGDAADSYVIVIQLGAILAVLSLYRTRVLSMLRGLAGRDDEGRSLLLCLLVAFIPAACVGLLLEDIIEAALFSPGPVSAALIVGGIVMIASERHLKIRAKLGKPLRGISDMTARDALWVGIAQCFSLWPGTSRSMTTIVGSQLRGFSDEASAEFSFLLALPTLGAATVYKLVSDLPRFQEMPGGAPLILWGNIVAFVVAYFAVKFFVAAVKRHGMNPFAYYRIAVGILFLGLVMAGVVAM